MNEKSYQICKSNIVEDYDSVLTPLQQKALILKLFGSKNVEDILVKNGVSQFIIRGKYALIVRNITYLGYDKTNNDYRMNKKRIQIPSKIKENFLYNNSKGLTTYYIGIYSYESEKNFLYAVFDTEMLSQKNANNSSAHVSVFDLLSAKIRGYFFKVDKGENKIYVFNQQNFISFFMDDNFVIRENAEKEYLLFQYLKSFWKTFPLKLTGISCYEEMYANNYSKTFESEWIGFYHEFKFEDFLKTNYTDLIEVYGDKKRDGIDLDLKTNIGSDFYADLKSDNEKYDIQGNKKATIEHILKKNGHVWYILVSFTDVIMDSERGFKTMEFYNSLKEDFNSKQTVKSKMKNISLDYKDKMKYSANVKTFYILDINKGNMKYLSDYLQGKNSNNKSRGIKIKITQKMFDDFKIYEFSKK